MNQNISFYNKNAKAFYDRTIAIDMHDQYQAFLNFIPESGFILDAGCGVGRDSKYFLSKGYEVCAFDASQEMVRLARIETNLDVLHQTFQEFSFDKIFDGIWAQASLLHVPYEDTKKVYKNLANALKEKGVFYASYKYGDVPMTIGERIFWNMNEETIKYYLQDDFDVWHLWVTDDRSVKLSSDLNQQWINVIARKK